MTTGHGTTDLQHSSIFVTAPEFSGEALALAAEEIRRIDELTAIPAYMMVGLPVPERLSTRSEILASITGNKQRVNPCA